MRLIRYKRGSFESTPFGKAIYGCLGMGSFQVTPSQKHIRGVISIPTPYHLLCMKDDWQLLLGLKWKSFFDIGNIRQSKKSLRQLHPQWPQSLTPSMPWVFLVRLAHFGTYISCRHCVSCGHTNISLLATFGQFRLWYDAQKRTLHTTIRLILRNQNFNY